MDLSIITDLEEERNKLRADIKQYKDSKDYWHGYAKRLRAELAKAKRKLELWETEVSKEMPSDFKDWWQNSKNEWPLVARLVLENRRTELEELREPCPDALTPDGPVCPRCGKRRGTSGVGGGSWVHY